MTLDCKAKDYILKCMKTAIDELQNQSFDGLRRLVPRLIVASEVFPDDTWTKELNLMSLAFTVIGASTEEEFPKIKKESKDELIKKYSEKLSAVYSAMEEEDTAKIDTLLKEFAALFFREVGL